MPMIHRKPRCDALLLRDVAPKINPALLRELLDFDLLFPAKREVFQRVGRVVQLCDGADRSGRW
jgi:hypothetical protein